MKIHFNDNSNFFTYIYLNNIFTYPLFLLQQTERVPSCFCPVNFRRKNCRPLIHIYASYNYFSQNIKTTSSLLLQYCTSSFFVATPVSILNFQHRNGQCKRWSFSLEHIEPTLESVALWVFISLCSYKHCVHQLGQIRLDNYLLFSTFF